jgi:hypothetical protein
MPTLSARLLGIACRDSPQDMHKDIEASVTSLMKAHSGAQLFVSGHSLVRPCLPCSHASSTKGGALAAICSVDLTTKYGYSVSMFTYGQPRVGNQAFAEYFNQTGVAVSLCVPWLISWCSCECLSLRALPRHCSAPAALRL